MLNLKIRVSLHQFYHGIKCVRFYRYSQLPLHPNRLEVRPTDQVDVKSTFQQHIVDLLVGNKQTKCVTSRFFLFYWHFIFKLLRNRSYICYLREFLDCCSIWDSNIFNTTTFSTIYFRHIDNIFYHNLSLKRYTYPCYSFRIIVLTNLLFALASEDMSAKNRLLFYWVTLKILIYNYLNRLLKQ